LPHPDIVKASIAAVKKQKGNLIIQMGAIEISPSSGLRHTAGSEGERR
jgi:hypothetical protein